MSAPTLSPDEQVKAAAFFDAGDFAKIVDRSDFTLPCWVQQKSTGARCPEVATHWCRCVSCKGFGGYLCTAHVEYLTNRPRPTSHSCGIQGLYADLIEVMPL